MVVIGEIREEYRGSSYWRFIVDKYGEEEDFYIPDIYYEESINVFDVESFKKTLEIIKFWGFDEIPDQLVRYVYNHLFEMDYLNKIAKHSLIKELIVKVLSGEKYEDMSFKIKNFEIFKGVFEFVVEWKLFGENIKTFYNYCINNRDEVIMYINTYIDITDINQDLINFKHLLISTYTYDIKLKHNLRAILIEIKGKRLVEEYTSYLNDINQKDELKNIIFHLIKDLKEHWQKEINISLFEDKKYLHIEYLNKKFKIEKDYHQVYTTDSIIRVNYINSQIIQKMLSRIHSKLINFCNS